MSREKRKEVGTMRIKIRMVSGKEIVFKNSKYKNVDKWVEGNFVEYTNGWWKMNKDSNVIIRIENIETIEELEE